MKEQNETVILQQMSLQVNVSRTPLVSLCNTQTKFTMTKCLCLHMATKKNTPHHIYYCWTEQTSTHIFIIPVTIQNEKTVKIKTLTQWRSRQRHHSIIRERTCLKLHILTARLHLHPTLKNTTEHLKQHHLKLRGSSARFQMIKNIITAITKLILNKYESEFDFNRRSGIKIFFWCSFHVLKTCDSTAETWHIFSVLRLYLRNLRPHDAELKRSLL